jgi:hypothetical protein
MSRNDIDSRMIRGEMILIGRKVILIGRKVILIGE